MPETSRRYQVMTTYAYCRGRCGWRDSGPAGTVEEHGRGHTASSGHEVRVVISREIILTRAAEAVKAGA